MLPSHPGKLVLIRFEFNATLLLCQQSYRHRMMTGSNSPDWLNLGQIHTVHDLEMCTACENRRICTQRHSVVFTYGWWYDGDNVRVVKELVHMTWVRFAQLRTTLLVGNQFQVSCGHWCRSMYDIFFILVFCFSVSKTCFDSLSW